MRIGSVPYLNAAPLTWGLESMVCFEPPSQLARRLHRGDLDAALLSITEALQHADYDVMDGFGIVSHGPVYSVVVAHRKPLAEVATLHVDMASCTSVNLLRVLLAGRGLSPRLVPLDNYAQAASLDAVLLIGDPAIAFRRTQASTSPEGPWHYWDLGEAWREMTNLPFVYAAWVLRRSSHLSDLVRRLSAAGEQGLQSLEAVIRAQTRFDEPFRRAYLGGHIQYRIGAAEKCGIERFGQLMAQHAGRPYRPISWVDVSPRVRAAA